MQIDHHHPARAGRAGDPFGVIWGVASTAWRHGPRPPQHSQALMQKRILFQGIAILLAILLLVIAGAGAGR